MNDDAALLRRYAEERDEGAFAELVQRHLALVYGAALRQLDGAAHRAEEVTQSVFTDLARKAGPLARRTGIVGWLYTSTHFAAAKLKRTEQRRQMREQEAHTMHELLSDSSTEADWEQLRPVLDEAMHELGDRDREVILQRFFQGRRLAEVGGKFGVGEDAARMRVERALGKLHALLVRRGITSTSAALGAALASQAAVAAPAGLAAAVTGAALAGGSAVGVAGWIGFMSTNKFAAGVSGLLLLLAAGIVVREVEARHEVETSLGEVRRDTEAWVARRRAVDERSRAAEQEAARLGQAIDEARRAADVAVPVQAVAATWDSEVEGRAFMARHPEFKQAFTDYHRAELNLRYGAFFKSRGLTPDQIETFGTLMLADSSQSEQLGLEMKAYTFSFADAASRPEMLASLGEDGRRKF